MSAGRLLEVFVDAPSEVCRARDVKGLYRKAEAGKISNVAGRGRPYEHPEAPALVLRTTELDAQAAADRLLRLAYGPRLDAPVFRHVRFAAFTPRPRIRASLQQRPPPR